MVSEGIITLDMVVKLNIHATVLNKIVSPSGRNIVRSISLKDVVDLPLFYPEAILNEYGEKLITKFFVSLSAFGKIKSCKEATFAAGKTALEMYEEDLRHLTKLIPGARKN